MISCTDESKSTAYGHFCVGIKCDDIFRAYNAFYSRTRKAEILCVAALKESVELNYSTALALPAEPAVLAFVELPVSVHIKEYALAVFDVQCVYFAVCECFYLFVVHIFAAVGIGKVSEQYE